MAQPGSSEVTRYVRYEHGGAVFYGILAGDKISRIEGDLFAARAMTGATVSLSDVKLRYPCEPRKILCVGLNYRSHLGSRPAPQKPELFYKPLTALLDPGGVILLPPDSKDVHFEGEIVIVIGKTAKRVSVDDAPNHIFGFTCGNDVSERNWQSGSQGDPPDRQWWRAKGSDTFGPLGPSIAVGLDYPNCRLQLRLNGETKQSQLVSDLIFSPPQVVSYVSQYVTLTPGDVIYTGTPGQTSPMKPGDTVEVEIDGIGILKNTVAAG